jgi:glycerol kinase
MGTANHILALDQGTTSSRAIVFDQFARQLAIARQPTTQTYPRSGWVNQDAAEIWMTTLETAREALHQARLTGTNIGGIGIVNQRETLVVWDRQTNSAISPAIGWQSRQSQPQVEALLARGMGPAYQSKTGLVPDAYFTASKLAWLLEDQSDLRRRADAGELLAGTVDSWLLWNLTGGAVHATDVSNASRTMLFDIQTLDWSPELIQDMAIPHQILPQVMSSAGVAGFALPQLFGAVIPVAGIAGDQQAALFGQTCFAPGEAKNTYGTGSFLLMNTGREMKRSSHRLLSTIAWQIEELVDYALEG